MRKMMHIDADKAARSEARLRAALERLNGAVRGQRYLVGGAFSRADLTAIMPIAIGASTTSAPTRTDTSLQCAP